MKSPPESVDVGKRGHYLKLFLVLVFISVCLKLLLFSCYHSTDFEVHRNWLSVTHHLDWTEWYWDETSVYHTLDYPPLFAWFEWVWAKFYAFVFQWLDRGDLVNQILGLRNHDVVEDGAFQYPYEIVAWHRLSVLVSDTVYFIGIYLVCQVMSFCDDYDRISAAALFLFSPSLVLVDHIHFQYNGFLMGIMMISIHFSLKRKYHLSALVFSILLCLKHIFVYFVPAYFWFFLIVYCEIKLSRIVMLGLNGLVVVFSVFLPFVLPLSTHSWKENVIQLFSRLFPFERGLTHAYWAPNFWSFYNALDKVLKILGERFLNLHFDQTASMTGGLVGMNQGSHAVLPTITPRITLILSLLVASILCIVTIKHQFARKSMFLLCIIHSGLAFFMFNWHVHEKAIITIQIPMIIYCSCLNNSKSLHRLNNFFQIITTYSLFPLLFRPEELPIKWAILILFVGLQWKYLRDQEADGICLFDKAYLSLIFPMAFYHHFFNPPTLPFVPLAMTSLYCFIGIVIAWIRLGWLQIQERWDHDLSSSSSGVSDED